MRTILDVSSVIYGGHNGSARRLRNFPIGGIRKLFGLINAEISTSDFVLCFDGGSTLKKEMLPTYKAGRVPDYSVIAQINLARELLTECDIPFYWMEGYEADDLIYSFCHLMSYLGDSEATSIYTDDRDLSCCVGDSVSIKNVTSNGKCIDRDNYEERVVNDKTVPYNSILLWKTFHGDASDNYKALRIPGLAFDSFAPEYIEKVSQFIGPGMLSPLAYTQYDVFCAVAEDYRSILSEEDFDKFLKSARIAFPQLVEVADAPLDQFVSEVQEGNPLYQIIRNHTKSFWQGGFNQTKFNRYCSLLGLNKMKPGSYVDPDSKEAQEFYGLLELRAKELMSGSLAVEYSKKKHETASSTETLQNLRLPL